LTTATLREGFSNFFASLTNPTHKRLVVQRLAAHTKAIYAMLSSHESRMFSSSILLVYEGDAQALEEGLQTDASDEIVMDVNVDYNVDETVSQCIARTKLIDFAHATFREGEGPDHNILLGVQKVLEHLKLMTP